MDTGLNSASHPSLRVARSLWEKGTGGHVLPSHHNCSGGWRWRCPRGTQDGPGGGAVSVSHVGSQRMHGSHSAAKRWKCTGEEGVNCEGWKAWRNMQTAGLPAGLGGWTQRTGERGSLEKTWEAGSEECGV